MVEWEPARDHCLDGRISDFLSRLTKAPSRALLLDYDGTLSPFTSEREQASPYPGVCEILNCIRQETDTRVAIVTGRQAADIPRLLGMTDVEVWGCHGLERLRPDGSSTIARVDARLLAAIEIVHELIRCEGISHLAERKTASIAIHWRGQEDLSDDILRRVRRIWSMIPDRNDLRLAPFDHGIEIRISRINKGDAVRSIFGELGPDAAMAYLGDDVSDEDAFGALIGRGLTILVRDAYRPTLAETWIKPGEDLLVFLRRWFSSCRRSSCSQAQEVVS